MDLHCDLKQVDASTTRVICKQEDLLSFKEKYQTVILKPLDGMGGESIYKFEEITAEHLKIFQDLTNNYQNYGYGTEFFT